MNKKEIRVLVIAALFTAITAVCTACISVPMPGGAGYVHFGDAIIMLAACLLPFPYALFVGSIGGAIADLIAFPVYAPFTFVVKLLLALCYSSKKDKIVCVRNIIAFIPTAIITIVGYYLAEVMLSGNWVSPILGTMPGNAIQVAGSIVIFLVFGIALDKLGFKKQIGKLLEK